jgi:hypothetical protein
MGHMLHRFLVLLVALFGSGCALLGGAQVESVATSAQKPSNVAMLVAVTEGGEPVTGLEPQNFKIYENQQELAGDDVKRTLLDRTQVTSERVVLLVELQGEPSSQERSRLVRAVEVFVEKLQPVVSSAVFAYDGSDALKLVGEYPRGGAGGSVAPLTTLGAPDGSRNLNGAIIDGVRQLELRLASEGRSVRLGTLVVLAKGPDLANRAAEDRMLQVLESVRFDVIAVGIGPDTPYLGFARGGVVHAQAADTLPIALEEAAMRVVATSGKYYLVSYCSPARAGERRLKIEVAYTTKTGDERGGNVEHDFDATGFGPGCNPQTPPKFAPPRQTPQSAPAASDPAGGAAPPPSEPGGAPVNHGPATNTPGEVAPPPGGSEYKP